LPAMMAPLIAPDRNAGYPIGAGFRQGLVDSRLIGAKRPAALQHQSDAFEGKMPFRSCHIRLDLNIHGKHSFSWTRDVSIDQDANGNVDSKNRQNNQDDQRCGHIFAPQPFVLLLRGAALPSYLLAAAVSARACTLLPSTRLIGGLRIT
jgi:hypothetical protein